MIPYITGVRLEGEGDSPRAIREVFSNCLELLDMDGVLAHVTEEVYERGNNTQSPDGSWQPIFRGRIKVLVKEEK